MSHQKHNRSKKMIGGHHDPSEDPFVWTNNAYQYYQNRVGMDQLVNFWGFMNQSGVDSSVQMITYDLIRQWHWVTTGMDIPSCHSLDQLMDKAKQIPRQLPLSLSSIIELFMIPTIVVYHGQPYKVKGDVDLMKNVAQFIEKSAVDPQLLKKTRYLNELDELLFTNAPRIVEKRIIDYVKH